MPVDSDTPRPVEIAAASVFVALSRLRGARIFHPRGVGYTGTLRVAESQPACAGVPLFERAGQHRALFRLSRAVGLPAPLPDILGLAVRVLDAHGEGRHQDFLLVTSVDLPVLHHLLLPGVIHGQSYSSVLPYRIGGELRLVGAQPAGSGEPRFRLAVASPMGRWRPVADLHVDERLPDDETERLAFNPWNTGGGIEPTGPFMGLRQSAYRGSQRGRRQAPT